MNPFAGQGPESKEQAMKSDNDRYLEELTCRAWNSAPRAARRAQAQAIRELVLGARRWAGWQRAAAWLKRAGAAAPLENAG